jgi:hypothetical protein
MNTRKFQLLGVAVVAVFAVGVLTTALASAAPTFLLAEWLVNGTAVTSEVNVETVGTILLEDTAATGKPDFVCSGKLGGAIGEDGLGVISEVLTLGGVAVSSPLGAQSLETCTSSSSLCEEPLLWPVGLPWTTLLELMEQGTPVEKFFVVLVGPSVPGTLIGWYVQCMKPFTVEDECTTESAITSLTLDTGGTLLLAGFEEAFTELAGGKLTLCSMNGGETGIVETSGAPGEDLLSGGGTLSASSESEEP